MSSFLHFYMLYTQCERNWFWPMEMSGRISPLCIGRHRWLESEFSTLPSNRKLCLWLMVQQLCSGSVVSSALPKWVDSCTRAHIGEKHLALAKFCPMPEHSFAVSFVRPRREPARTRESVCSFSKADRLFTNIQKGWLHSLDLRQDSGFKTVAWRGSYRPEEEGVRQRNRWKKWLVFKAYGV